NLTTSQRLDDGLVLRDAYITSAARCAPPGNKPTSEELANCLSHLTAEVNALPRIQVVIGLGKIAFEAYLQFLKSNATVVRPKPDFAHGLAHTLPDGITLFGCYHPSRQNTNTGKLTPRMLDTVFTSARQVLR